MICIPKEKESEGCPITSLHFKKKEDTLSSNYQYVDFNTDYKLGFSKSFDSLPATNFELQVNMPCHNPLTQSSVFENIKTRDPDQTHYLNDFVYKLQKGGLYDYVDLSYGCLKYPSGKDLAESSRYEDITRGHTELQFNLN